MRNLARSAHMGLMELVKSQKEAENPLMQFMAIQGVQNFQLEPLAYPERITEMIQYLRKNIVKMPFIPFWAENSAPKQYPNSLSSQE